MLKHCIMQTYEGVVAKLHLFLTLAPFVSEWIGQWMGPRAGLTVVAKRTFPL